MSPKEFNGRIPEGDRKLLLTFSSDEDADRLISEYNKARENSDRTNLYIAGIDASYITQLRQATKIRETFSTRSVLSENFIEDTFDSAENSNPLNTAFYLKLNELDFANALDNWEAAWYGISTGDWTDSPFSVDTINQLTKIYDDVLKQHVANERAKITVTTQQKPTVKPASTSMGSASDVQELRLDVTQLKDQVTALHTKQSDDHVAQTNQSDYTTLHEAISGLTEAVTHLSQAIPAIQQTLAEHGHLIKDIAAKVSNAEASGANLYQATRDAFDNVETAITTINNHVNQLASEFEATASKGRGQKRKTLPSLPPPPTSFQTIANSSMLNESFPTPNPDSTRHQTTPPARAAGDRVR